MKYGVGAAALALAIIAVAIIANPYLVNNPGKTTSNGSAGSSTSQQANQPPGNFLVLLTDPPTVPAGTTQLNVTYSSITIQVKYANGTSASVPVIASGTVNLLSLVNVSQTIGSTNIPAGSTVSSLKFVISSASATVNGQTFPVTILSSQLVVPIKGGQVINQTRSAALLDLSPTLVEVDATNSTGGAVSYYVLVPSATAIVKSGASQGQEKVGTKTQLDQNDKTDLDSAQKTVMANVTITAATLHTAGNKTTFSVTLKNQGTSNATIFGLTLHGNFSSSGAPSIACAQTTSSTSTSSSSKSTTSTTTTTSSSHGNQGNPPGQTGSAHGQGQGQGKGEGQGGCNSRNGAQDHPDTIPFKVNATTLAPLFGDGSDHVGSSTVTLKAGQSITLSFTGVIGIKTDNGQHGQNLIIGANSGTSYTIRLDGEGFQTAQVTAA